jgi:hypothetical protein
MHIDYCTDEVWLGDAFRVFAGRTMESKKVRDESKSLLYNIMLQKDTSNF